MQNYSHPKGVEDISHHIIGFKNKSKFKISWGIFFTLKTRFLKNKKQKDFFDNVYNVYALKKQTLILPNHQPVILGIHPLSVCIILSTSFGTDSDTATTAIFIS